jgi:biopolymer transport protein ExbD
MKKREHIAPDLTPIIDIVFLILIFFMVSSTFKKEELALLLTLPKAQSATVEVKQENINIELGKEKLAYKGKKMDFKMLDVMLKEVGKKDEPVNIRIDKEVSYGRVTKLFDMLNKYGLNNLALENERK